MPNDQMPKCLGEGEHPMVNRRQSTDADEENNCPFAEIEVESKTNILETECRFYGK